MSEKPTLYYEGIAAAYKKFRCSIPDEIVNKTVAFLSQKLDPSQCVAVDVGCGSGQSTLPLAAHFKEVNAFDASSNQIEETKKANPSHNVKFQRADAESIPLPDCSVHLVSAVDALHWFDMEAFFKEADRLLVPDGVLALSVGSAVLRIKGFEEETDALFNKFAFGDGGEFWDRKTRKAFNMYRDVQMPYAEYSRDESIVTSNDMTVAHLEGRLRTYSGVAKYLETKPEEAERSIKKYIEELLNIIGSTKSASDTNVTMLKAYTLLLSRKPASH